MWPGFKVLNGLTTEEKITKTVALAEQRGQTMTREQAHIYLFAAGHIDEPFIKSAQQAFAAEAEAPGSTPAGVKSK